MSRILDPLARIEQPGLIGEAVGAMAVSANGRCLAVDGMRSASLGKNETPDSGGFSRDPARFPATS
jgi:hypothetical protein